MKSSFAIVNNITPKKVTKKRRKRKKLTAEQKAKNRLTRSHINSVRAVFRNAGFKRADEIAEKDVTFDGQAGEFDDAFVYENIVVLVEYTTSQPSDVSGHLKNKKVLYSKVVADQEGFLSYLRGNFPKFDERLGPNYHEDKYILKILYCSYYEFDESVKGNVDEPIYLDFPYLKYFEKISSTIKKSSRYELLHFLEIDPSDVGNSGKFVKKSSSEDYTGSILPESASGFPKGYKVVSFYADAAALLRRAYVLRRDGWRGSFQAYQRMIIPAKIDAIRKKLKAEKQVFINNLIVTLPEDVRPLAEDGQTIDISKLTEVEPVEIKLPLRANSIGLIDGQHRLYSYYESEDDDTQIALLREQQNLLVTGIVYPDKTPQTKKERFEAELFLAINSNQANAPASLRQEIEVVLNPFSATAIGRQVLQRLAKSGPLHGHIETSFFETGKLKTTSIVSYGLGPLIKLSGTDSLFFPFQHDEKEKIATGESPDGLEAYLNFAVANINMFLSAVKSNIPASRWTADKRVSDKVLSVTFINAFLITLRLLIKGEHKLELTELRAKFDGIDQFSTEDFHSSQYGRMAEKIYEQYFTSATSASKD